MSQMEMPGFKGVPAHEPFDPESESDAKMSPIPKPRNDTSSDSFRLRSQQAVHRGILNKLARAQHVLYRDLEGYQRGDSLSRLNAAVSSFLAEAHLVRDYPQDGPDGPRDEDGSPRFKSGVTKATSGRRSRRTNFKD